MALTLKDRVLETCSAPGTGAVTLLGAVTGYQTFSSAIGNANTCYYTIADQNGANWEVGIGTYATSGNTLTRTTVLSSSNAGSTVNFATGTQNVFVTYPSERSVNLSSSALTSGRVTYATTDGLLTDSANMTFDGTTLTTTNVSILGNASTNPFVVNTNANGSLPSASLNGLIISQNYTAGAAEVDFFYNQSSYVGDNGGFRFYQRTGTSTANEMMRMTQNSVITYTGGTERMRVDSSGNVGISTSSPATYDGKVVVVKTSAGTETAAMSLVNSDSSANTAVSLGFSPNVNIDLARITAIRTTSGGLTDLAFKTYGGSPNQLREQMRITSAGLVGIGLTPSGTTVQLQVSSDALISGLTVGKGGGAIGSNTALGSASLAANTTGTENTGIGQNALKAITTGTTSTAVGDNALQAVTTGTDNTAVGSAALYATTGSYNIAMGRFAGYSNTTGSNISALGFQSLFLNTTGSYNTAVGTASLYSNTTASNNTAVGYQAGYTNQLGVQNTFIGSGAGYNSNPATGTGYNTCVGYFAGYGLTTGVKNTFIGSFQSGGTTGSGSAITTGSSNSILGAFTGNGTGLDIRTSNNYIVLSDGDGVPRQVIDTNGNVGIGTTSNNVYDQVGAPRPLLVQRSDTSTTIAGSLASITISNGDTTTNNTAQINFAAITGASTNQYSGATISAIFGARTNGQYPSGQLVFSTSTATNSAPTEKIRIDSSGNVGIGTSSPSVKLHVVGSIGNLNNSQTVPTPDNGAVPIQVISNNYSNGSGETNLWNTAATLTGGIRLMQVTGSGTYNDMAWFQKNAALFYTGNTERMRIDSSGNVGIATTSPSTYKDSQGAVLVVGGSPNYATIQTRGDGPTGYGNGVSYGGSYSTNPINGARMWIGAAGASGQRGGILFYTKDLDDNTTQPLERMRINSSGNVGIGTASPDASAILDAQSTTKGVRMPNMTTTQKNAISSPAAGLMVFDTTLAKLCVYSGSAWQTITSI